MNEEERKLLDSCDEKALKTIIESLHSENEMLQKKLVIAEERNHKLHERLETSFDETARVERLLNDEKTRLRELEEESYNNESSSNITIIILTFLLILMSVLCLSCIF
jgi:hypothetical protein